MRPDRAPARVRNDLVRVVGEQAGDAREVREESRVRSQANVAVLAVCKVRLGEVGSRRLSAMAIVELQATGHGHHTHPLSTTSSSTA